MVYILGNKKAIFNYLGIIYIYNIQHIPNSENFEDDNLLTEYTDTSNNIDHIENNNYDHHTPDKSSIEHQVIDVNIYEDIEEGEGGTQTEVFTNNFLSEKKEALSNSDGKKQKNHLENETFAKGLKSGGGSGRGVLNNGMTITPSYLDFALMLLPAMTYSITVNRILL